MAKWAAILILAIVSLAILGFVVDAVRVAAWIALVILLVVLAGRFLLGRNRGD